VVGLLEAVIFSDSLVIIVAALIAVVLAAALVALATL
jgi:hypothetical protein